MILVSEHKHVFFLYILYGCFTKKKKINKFSTYGIR